MGNSVVGNGNRSASTSHIRDGEIEKASSACFVDEQQFFQRRHLSPFGRVNHTSTCEDHLMCRARSNNDRKGKILVCDSNPETQVSLAGKPPDLDGKNCKRSEDSQIPFQKPVWLQNMQAKAYQMR